MRCLTIKMFVVMLSVLSTGYCTSICNCNLHYLGQKRCVSSKVPVSCLWLSVKCTEGIVGRALYHHFLPLQVWYTILDMIVDQKSKQKTKK
jgi:hypothetical protein